MMPDLVRTGVVSWLIVMTTLGMCGFTNQKPPVAQQKETGASTVRGRVNCQGSSGEVYPAQSIKVALESPDKASSSTVSGSDGMYSFYHVGPGTYNLTVWLPSGKTQAYT